MERKKLTWREEVRKRNYNEREGKKVRNISRSSWRNPIVTLQGIISLCIWSQQISPCGPAVLKQSFYNLNIRIEYFGSRHPLISSSEETFAFPAYVLWALCPQEVGPSPPPHTCAQNDSIFRMIIIVIISHEGCQTCAPEMRHA